MIMSMSGRAEIEIQGQLGHHQLQQVFEERVPGDQVPRPSPLLRHDAKTHRHPNGGQPKIPRPLDDSQNKVSADSLSDYIQSSGEKEMK